MKIGFYQYKPVFGKLQKNLEKVISSLENVTADLMVLPELAFSGYHFQDKAELEPLAEDPQNSQIIDGLTDICSRKDMHIVTGFAEKSGSKIYNSAALIGPRGLIHVYRKIQLFFREKEMFEPGDRPLQVHDVKGVKVGMMICFDWIFPEISRILALQGADIICHPSNLVLSYCQHAMITRSIENNIFAITTNRFGADNRPHGTLKFTGKSQIVAPRGKLLYRAPSQKEALYVIKIDPSEAREKKMTDLNHLFKDRRPELYGKLCKPLS